jgi:NADPH:quinone reductase-like Zn-dependent oxidoreductase
MKEAIVHPDTSVTIQESPIPTPGFGEILVKVVVAGTLLK